MSQQRPSRLHSLMLVFIVFGAFLAFFPSLQNGFVDWDDPQLILNNPLIRSFSPGIFISYDPELYIPITLLNFQIEHALFGFNPLLFHLDSLLIHIVNAMLVFRLVMLLLRQKAAKDHEWMAFGAALLFAVHPLHTEAVAWASARKELLCALFSLASLIAYIQSAHGLRRKAWWWSIVFFALAVLSKPTAVMLPGVMLLIDVWNDERIDRNAIIEKWPHWIITVIAIIIAFFGKSATIASLSLPQIILLAFRSTVFYLAKLFWPVHLSAIYPAPTDLTLGSVSQWNAILIVLLCIAAAIVLRKKMPELLTGLGFFLLALAPSFLAFAKSNDVTLAADRYAYLPSIGILFLFAAVLHRLMRSEWMRRMAIGCMGIMAITFVFFSRAQARIWSSSDSLFTNVLALYPGSPVAQNNIGFHYLQQNKLDEAQPYFIKAVELKSDYADALLNLGIVSARKGRYEEAEPLIRKALDINPRLVQAQFSLGGIFLKRGALERAEEAYEKTLALQSDYLPALWQLAQVELRLGKRDEARAAYQKVLEIDGSYRGKLPELDALLNK